MIKKINYQDTYEIRHVVMWPNQPLAFIKLEDDATGLHYGYFDGNRLVSVVSLFVNNHKIQFRKFATLKECQGLGYGTALLNHVIQSVEQLEVTHIWCNARVEKTFFYERFGMHQTDKTFERKGQTYIIMEKKL